MKLNLACGQTRIDGFEGVDIVRTDYSDVVHDLLSFPWPFEADSIEKVVCNHFIEHIPMREINGKDLFFCFFDELWRVLQPGGQAMIVAPYGASDRAFQDPTHRRFIVAPTFLYLNRGWRKMNKLDHYDVRCNFAFEHRLVGNPEFDLKHDDAKPFIQSHYWNSVLDINVTLTKLAWEDTGG